MALEECNKVDLYDMYQDIPALEIGSSNKIKGISYDAFLIKYKEYIDEEKKINEILNTTTKRFILKSKNKLIGEVGIRTTLNDFWINTKETPFVELFVVNYDSILFDEILFAAGVFSVFITIICPGLIS